MNRIEERQEELIEEFSAFDDWMDKYALIIDMGNSLAPLDEAYRTDQNLIEGCQSKVWLHAAYEDGKVNYYADGDAVIVKGLVSMMVGVLSGNTPQEILDTNLYFVDTIGMAQHLSPTRSNGLLAMIKQMRLYALAFKTKEGN